MRRKDRKLTTKEELLDILENGKIVQIAFQDKNQPYIVTLNYGFYWTNENPVLYFHCANEGRKIECIKFNPEVCFSISICDPFVKGENACNYGMKYRSIVGYGKIRIVTDSEEKINGLNLIMKQYTGNNNWTYEDEMMNKTTVISLEVHEITGKRKK